MDSAISRDVSHDCHENPVSSNGEDSLLVNLDTDTRLVVVDMDDLGLVGYDIDDPVVLGINVSRKVEPEVG